MSRDRVELLLWMCLVVIILHWVISKLKFVSILPGHVGIKIDDRQAEPTVLEPGDHWTMANEVLMFALKHRRSIGAQYTELHDRARVEYRVDAEQLVHLMNCKLGIDELPVNFMKDIVELTVEKVSGGRLRRALSRLPGVPGTTTSDTQREEAGLKAFDALDESAKHAFLERLNASIQSDLDLKYPALFSQVEVDVLRSLADS